MNNLTLLIPSETIRKIHAFVVKHLPMITVLMLLVISCYASYFYYTNHLSLAYNDARSHLNISRRVVEGLKPGLAQLGSVWLPLPHLVMVATVWNDFMWHSGLSGAIPSMLSYIVTGYVIYRLLEKFGMGPLGRVFGVAVFALNLNILYLQSTAMTELLLLSTMTLGVYKLISWHLDNSIFNLIQASFWIMLSTLVRYDGWFLLFWATVLVVLHGMHTVKNLDKKLTITYIKSIIQKGEGYFVFFCTLGGLGVFLWLMWNAVIFKDPFYFAFGPFSAHAQQSQLEDAGVLVTKHNLLQSIRIYWYSLAYNSTVFTVVLGLLGQIAFWFDKHISKNAKIAATALLAPLVFNIIALYFGHSVLFIQGISGNTWFNVRYGVMLLPSLAIFSGYLIHRFKPLRFAILGLFCFVTFFHVANGDAVTIDDGRVGSSQKNVSEVSGWLKNNAGDKKGFILISAASHDAIIFSSGLPMKRFIHEGTGTYWEHATAAPDQWARWIIMRTNDENDLGFRLINKSGQLYKYNLVQSFPFADIYELRDENDDQLNTEPSLPKQR